MANKNEIKFYRLVRRVIDNHQWKKLFVKCENFFYTSSHKRYRYLNIWWSWSYMYMMSIVYYFLCWKLFRLYCIQNRFFAIYIFIIWWTWCLIFSFNPILLLFSFFLKKKAYHLVWKIYNTIAWEHLINCHRIIPHLLYTKKNT